MKELKIFKNKQFGEVRVLDKDGEPWFAGKDVAEILGYSNTKDAIAAHVDTEDKTIIQKSDFPTLDIPNRGMTVINESGLYSLMLSSKLPQAKQFKHWVTSEVLPSIRKHGGYIAGQETLSDDELLARAVMVANSKIAERDKLIAEKDVQIQQMKPKEVFADAVATSQTSILIGELAKLLRQNGVEIGQNRLFAWLRENGYLIKRKGADYNMPTQKSMELGLFEIKERTINNPDGTSYIKRTTKVTGKGQQYFINKFLAEKAS